MVRRQGYPLPQRCPAHSNTRGPRPRPLFEIALGNLGSRVERLVVGPAFSKLRRLSANACRIYRERDLNPFLFAPSRGINLVG